MNAHHAYGLPPPMMRTFNRVLWTLPHALVWHRTRGAQERWKMIAVCFSRRTQNVNLLQRGGWYEQARREKILGGMRAMCMVKTRFSECPMCIPGESVRHGDELCVARRRSRRRIPSG